MGTEETKRLRDGETKWHAFAHFVSSSLCLFVSSCLNMARRF